MDYRPAPKLARLLEQRDQLRRDLVDIVPGGDAFAARGLLVIPDENAVTATTAVLPSRPVEEERRPVWEEAALRPAIAAMA